jgi:hypothetical protein
VLAAAQQLAQEAEQLVLAVSLAAAQQLAQEAVQLVLSQY